MTKEQSVLTTSKSVSGYTHLPGKFANLSQLLRKTTWAAQDNYYCSGLKTVAKKAHFATPLLQQKQLMKQLHETV
jgi:L-lysine 2,3-aminomutase